MKEIKKLKKLENMIFQDIFIIIRIISMGFYNYFYIKILYQFVLYKPLWFVAINL